MNQSEETTSFKVTLPVVWSEESFDVECHSRPFSESSTSPYITILAASAACPDQTEPCAAGFREGTRAYLVT